MIFDSIYIIPVIDFGFNKQSITRPINTNITLLQEEIYKEEEYSINLISADANLVYKDFGRIVFNFTQAGNYQVSVNVKRTFDGTNLNSNVLDLTITHKSSMDFSNSDNSALMQTILTAKS